VATTPADGSERANWTFLSNHAHVLVALAGNPELRLRDIAVLVGITERTAQLIVADLERQGYLSRTRIGRRNRYDLHLDGPLRHPLEAHHTVADLVRLIGPTAD